MPYNGSGGFTIINTFVPGTTILSSAVNQNYSDIATAGLSNCLTKDGQQVWGANQKAGSNIITGLGSGTAGGNSVEWAQWQTSALQPGMMMDWGGTSAPAKWLLCSGNAVSRTTYALLFNALGTLWGAGDGVTTFNIPDFRGRVTAGKDDMGGSSASRITVLATDSGTITGVNIASAGGSQSHVQTFNELNTHTHTGTVSLSGTQTFSNVVTSGGGSNSGSASPPGLNVPGSITVDTVNFAASFTGNNAGSSVAMAWLQPTIICNKIIFAGV